MILIIPAVPSGSYFAEGFVMISMFSITLAGICSSISEASKIEGLPSTKTVKFEFPRKLTFPSISTLTDGTFSKTSTAVPLAAVICLLTGITFLSI